MTTVNCPKKKTVHKMGFQSAHNKKFISATFLLLVLHATLNHMFQVHIVVHQVLYYFILKCAFYSKKHYNTIHYNTSNKYDIIIYIYNCLHMDNRWLFNKCNNRPM